MEYVTRYDLHEWINKDIQTPNEFKWRYLSENPKAIHLLQKNFDKVDWKTLSGNPNAIHLLEKNLDKVDWNTLSGNPNAIHLLEKNLDKVCWFMLSRNPNAIHLLGKNLDKVNWYIVMNDIIKGISAKQTINNYKDSNDVIARRTIRSSWNNNYATGTVNGQTRAIGEFRAVTNSGDFLSRKDYVCDVPNGISSSKVAWRSRIGNIINNCDGSGIPCSNTNIAVR
jgi:hypothetical protein